MDGNRLSSNQVFRELFRLVPIGLDLFGAVNAIEADFDLFVGSIQDGDGITIGYVNDFGLEVGGVG